MAQSESNPRGLSDIPRRSPGGRGRRAVRRLAWALPAWLLGLLGCQEPWAVQSNRYSAGEEPVQRAVLGASQRTEARAAMGSVAQGASVRNVAVAAEHGVRWSDVEAAAALAAAECELAVLSSERDAGESRIRFSLKTINDRPGVLIIRRVDPPRVYEAQAAIGRFEDDQAAAAALLKAFDESMRALGHKRRMPE